MDGVVSRLLATSSPPLCVHVRVCVCVCVSGAMSDVEVWGDTTRIDNTHRHTLGRTNIARVLFSYQINIWGCVYTQHAHAVIHVRT